MRTEPIKFPRHPLGGRGFRSRTVALIAGVAISACTAVRLDAAFVDDFENLTASQALWTFNIYGGTGGQTVSNGHVRVHLRPTGDTAFSWLQSTRTWTLQEGRTLEFRADLRSSNDDGAVAFFGFRLADGNRSYRLLVDEDTVALIKRSNTPFALFFKTNGVPVKVSNVKLVVSLTGAPSSVLLKFKILDNDNAGAVIFEREFWDTAAAEPMQVGSDTPPESHLGQSGHFYVGLYHDTVKLIDPNVTLLHFGEAEVVYDNAEVLEYDVPSLQIEKSVLLTWSENTEEEQIIVMADSVTSTNWTPCPEPTFIGSGGLSVAVPITQSQQFFKLVPGRQFADDFSDTWGPFTNRNSWVVLFQNPGEEWIVTNGVLQITCDPPTLGLALFPLGTNVEAELQDSYMSVDILDWVASGTNMSAFSLCARARIVTETLGEAYMGGLTHNRDGIPGKMRPWIYDGSGYNKGTDFYTQDYPLPYRLRFSVVGRRLSFQVLSLTNGQLIREVPLPYDTHFATGFGGLYVQRSQANPGDAFTITADNFFMTGTKPR